jgi:hypothetical protein
MEPKNFRSGISIGTATARGFTIRQEKKQNSRSPRIKTMSPLSEIAKAAAVTSVKGAGITLASTTASCYLACQIEVRAHRFVYHYFPEKYADVEHANGLTQQQLDAVREYRSSNRAVGDLPKEDTVMMEHKISHGPEDASFGNKYWKEESLSLAKVAEGFSMPSQDIIACSMTA